MSLEASGRSELQEVGELGGGNVPEGQPSLQHCISLSFIAEWPDKKKPLCSITHLKAHLQFGKKTQKNYSLGE